MTSAIAWLDASAAEQRRVREIMALFAQQESRDELGIGQIRDVLSDALFPGVSTIQTRARYFLFVPWLFHLAARRVPPRKVVPWVATKERTLIEVLRKAGATEGLIGRRAGPSVKTLPSTIYWSGLQEWGIVADLLPDGVAQLAVPVLDDADELASRRLGPWHATLPPPPAGFPDQCPTGFALAREEASWLRERIVESAPDTLLEHLVLDAEPIDESSSAPWLDPACANASDIVRDTLVHARLFSLTMHGPALLYNLLVAEAFEAKGFTRVTSPVDDYRDRLAEWTNDVLHSEADLVDWDVSAFWSRVLAKNPRIGLVTRMFVDAWIRQVRDGMAALSIADDAVLRAMVRERELTQKRSQARLSNDRLLGAWNGASGAAPLIFRWNQARRIVLDIRGGLEGSDAGA